MNKRTPMFIPESRVIIASFFLYYFFYAESEVVVYMFSQVSFKVWMNKPSISITKEIQLEQIKHRSTPEHYWGMTDFFELLSKFWLTFDCAYVL